MQVTVQFFDEQSCTILLAFTINSNIIKSDTVYIDRQLNDILHYPKLQCRVLRRSLTANELLYQILHKT